jgi:DNA-nicking Smr family endonuclease
MGKGKAERGTRSDDALDLWAHATRDIKPLKQRKPPPVRKTGPKPAAKDIAAPDVPSMATLLAPARPAAKPKHPELAPGAAPGVDARTAERLRRGDYPVDARLDLHGHTQEEAHRALIAFVEQAWRVQRRCLLVITGKGRGEAVGVLKSSLPRWLNEAPLRARILAFATARPRHGGGGAFYILLKRQR